MTSGKIFLLVVVLATIVSSASAAFAKDRAIFIAAGGASDAQDVMKFYNQHNYAAAADAFERASKTIRPDANTCYYAALAYRQINKETRARQLFQYIVTSFPGTQQAQYAQQALSYGQSNK